MTWTILTLHMSYWPPPPTLLFSNDIRQNEKRCFQCFTAAPFVQCVDFTVVINAEKKSGSFLATLKMQLILLKEKSFFPLTYQASTVRHPEQKQLFLHVYFSSSS